MFELIDYERRPRHIFDTFTGECNRCGCRHSENKHNPRPCHEGDNIVSILPRLKYREMAKAGA